MKPPDFLQPNFTMHANVWCEKEGRINRHLLEIVKHDDNHISYWRTCCDCKHEYDTLKRLGVEKPNPRKADRMPTTEWVFLVLHPEDIIA